MLFTFDLLAVTIVAIVAGMFKKDTPTGAGFSLAINTIALSWALLDIFTTASRPEHHAITMSAMVFFQSLAGRRAGNEIIVFGAFIASAVCGGTLFDFALTSLATFPLVFWWMMCAHVTGKLSWHDAD